MVRFGETTSIVDKCDTRDNIDEVGDDNDVHINSTKIHDEKVSKENQQLVGKKRFPVTPYPNPPNNKRCNSNITAPIDNLDAFVSHVDSVRVALPVTESCSFLVLVEYSLIFVSRLRNLPHDAAGCGSKDHRGWSPWRRDL